jgi:hypothetical protein
MRVFRFSIIACAVVIFLSVLLGSGAMRDNSDYGRVIRCIGVVVEQNFSTKDYRYNFSDLEPLWCSLVTPMSLVAGTTRLVLTIFSQSALTIFQIALVLSTIWVVGVFALIRHNNFNKNRLSVVFLILITAAFANYFRSFYEETIVLAGMPWFLLGLWRWQLDGKPGLILISAACLLSAKVQMVGALPLILAIVWRARGGVPRDSTAPASAWVPAVLTIGLIGLSALSLARWDYTRKGEVNSYNRFYNGVGQALQGVADWPARAFRERNLYENQHRAQLQQLTLAFEPNPGAPLMGTRFSPTGMALWRSYIARGELATFSEILAPGALGNFIPWLLARPYIWPEILRSIAVTTVRSDYRVQYLNNSTYLPGLTEFQDFARSWLGVYGLAILALAAGVGRSLWLPGLFLLTLPLAVWGGDGFYEFEKHFAPYWMLLPLVFTARQSGVETSTPPP